MVILATPALAAGRRAVATHSSQAPQQHLPEPGYWSWSVLYRGYRRPVAPGSSPKTLNSRSSTT